MHSEQSDNSSDESADIFNKLAPQSSKPVKKEVKQASPIPQKVISLNIMKERHPRLVIDRMVLNNFKSYSGQQEIGTFHRNFTSVVGPNGSGKSNLIESMLFIFGFNASWMRLNKLSQLIHNSSTASGISRASVEVYFKKVQETQDGSLIEIPGSEFSIRRTVNTSSVSKYFVQNRESTQAEVKERLKAEGIDLSNNRFLILQGEVQQISQMKQKSGDMEKPGLLEYLEEIIGSSQFIERIEECSREYAQAEQQKHEKGQLMRLVENQLKGMTKAKDEAVKYVKREKKIFQLQNVLNQVDVAVAKEEGNRLKEALSELEKTRDRIIAQEKERLKKQSERIKDIRKNKAEMDEVQKKLDKYSESCNSLQVEDKNITNDVAYKSEDLVKYERKIQDADKEFTKIISQCEEIKHKLPKSTEILNERNNKLEKMRVELSKYEKPVLRQKIKECDVEIQKINIESNALRNKLESIKEGLGKQKLSKGGIESKIKQYQLKINENIEIRDKIEKAKGVAEKIIRQKMEKVSEINQNRQAISNQIKQIDSQLREQLTESQHQGQMSNMFKDIMQQGFPGVLGRLGDLGEVSRQYDEIITTCCGRLDNLVVTDLKTAKDVLAYLKNSRAGRATCIILDIIGDQRNYMNRPFEKLSKATRLFDVIKFKTEQAKLAFYFALSDTLYCEDSDLGMEYAMKNENHRRRVICKNKQRGGYITYEMNGLMVGSAAKRGGFDQKAAIKGKNKGKDEGKFKELENRKRDLVRQLEQITKKKESYQGELNTARQDSEQMKRQMISIKETLKEHQDQIKDLTQMLGKAEGKSISATNMERETEAITRDLSVLDKKKGEFQQTLINLEEEQKKGENKQINLKREAYKQQRQEVNKMQKQYEREKAILQSAIKRIDDIKNGKKDNERTLQRLKKDINTLKNEQLALENKVSEIIGKMTACEQKLKQCKKIDQQLRMIMQDDDKQVRQSKAKVQKARKDVENCFDNFKKQQQDLKIAEGELDRIRQQYRQLTASYSFMENIDEIEKMAIGTSEKFNEPLSPRNASILEQSMLNNSMSMDSNQSARTFQIDSLMKFEPYHNLNEDQLENFVIFKDKLTGLIASQTAALKKLQGSNLDVINQYRTKYGHYRERLSQFEAVRERQQQLKRLIDGLKADRLKLFREGFGVINCKLKEVYQHLTRGGDAELQLIDSLDPFSDGVNFSVRPPKKSWKQVNKLSGGEKTLSSLSLIFALHYYKPTPLYFMDEIDAALDFKNVSIVADYIKKRTKDAQFIIISLRNNMFDLANKLIGVYKTNDKTRVINLQPAKLLSNRDQRSKESQENRLNEANYH